jgi:hypothetical protein
MVKKSKRMGRPPKPAKERKKRNFTFRETEDFHRLIAASAKADNRKIGEQIVLLCREALQSRRQKLDIAATAEATAHAVAERVVGARNLLLQARKLAQEWDRIDAYLASGELSGALPELPSKAERRETLDAALRAAEEDAIMLVLAQNPSMDEQAARERVNALVEKWGKRPQERVLGLWFALRYFERRAMEDESK